jgi:hypothetical protein
LVDAIKAIADAKGVTVAQIAIAWILSRGEDIVPVIGSRRRATLAESLRALIMTLSGDELAALDLAVPKGAAVRTYQDVGRKDAGRSGKRSALTTTLAVLTQTAYLWVLLRISIDQCQ